MSFYTVNIYMNDVNDGGCTRFYKTRSSRNDDSGPDLSVRPKAGLCLVFRQPPGESYWHDGEALGSGSKFLFRSDVMYRKVFAESS